MHATRSLIWPTLVALGVTLVGCGDPKVNIPGIPIISFGDGDGDTGDDGGIDGGDVNCDGEYVGSEESRIRYKDDSPAPGEGCMVETQTRVCLGDGTWSDWSGTYGASECEAPDAGGDAGGGDEGPCEDGATESREMWDGVVTATDAGVEGECLKETQTRTCSGGSWGAWSGTYAFPQCPLLFDDCDGQPHGTVQSQDRYAAATVEPGQQCQKETQTRTCNDGTWSAWSGTYGAETCAVLEHGSCDGQAHGTVQTQVRYAAEEAPKGGQCESQEQTRTCQDGTWSDWEADGEDMLFTKTSCVPYGQKSCVNPDGGSLAHGAKYTWKRYQAASVPFDQTCKVDSQEVTCDDGVLPPYTGTYTFTSCAPENPVGCAADGGGTVANGSTKTQTRWQAARVAFNAECESESQVSTCTNGVWSAYVGTNQYTATECKHNCDGGDHGDTQSRTMYQASEVAVPATCKPQVQERTCSDGTWSTWTGSTTYGQTSCRAYCTSSGAKVYEGESEKRVRYSAAFPTTACAPEEQTRTCSSAGMGNWVGSASFLGCGQLPADNQKNVASCRWVSNDVPYCVQYNGIGAGSNTWDCVGSGRTWEEGRPCAGRGGNNTAYGTCEYDVLTMHVTEYYYSVDPANKTSCDSSLAHDWTNL